MVCIYVLECEKNKYYVGRTDCLLEDRMKSHKTAWTKKYKPIRVLEHFDGDNYDEDKYTKVTMAKYGIENVRGGVYCQINLPDITVDFLCKELFSARGSCFSCGSSHFSRRCPKKHKDNTSLELAAIAAPGKRRKNRFSNAWLDHPCCGSGTVQYEYNKLIYSIVDKEKMYAVRIKEEKAIIGLVGRLETIPFEEKHRNRYITMLEKMK